jgi:uncharacterized protein YndB with AHSA1/START domain
MERGNTVERSTVGGKPALELRRRIAAPPGAVFAAWTEPAHLSHWFGPHGAKVLSAEVEPRQGGRFRVRFSTPDGEEHYVSGTYLAFEPVTRLVFTWQWITMPERRSQVTVAIAPDGDGSRSILTLCHEQFADAPARDRHIDGWSGALDKLAAHLAEPR